MKREITFISDTHGKHYELNKDLPGGWMIIHCGDISNRGLMSEINDFTNWFGKLPYEHKIFIAGNHDFGFEDVRHHNDPAPIIPDGVIYLEDEMVEIDGIKIYGSPWQPRFYDWAFNVNRGEEIAKKWAMIPGNADIVVTHGPVFGVLDDTIQGQRVGCEDLYMRIMDVKPKIHACGHIHYGYGVKDYDGVTFVNASSLGERYTYINKPIVLDYDQEIPPL
jgi:Icc-related predicted phosphoesterase